MESFWIRVEDRQIQQGDLLEGCFIPVWPDPLEESDDVEIGLSPSNILVVTQSCDLLKPGIQLVAACPIYSISEFETTSPEFRNRKKWNEVRAGRREGLHLLASPAEPENNERALVTDFRVVFSLPYTYLSRRAEEMGSHWRLKSPFLEHFSQAFARFFMRVGLPSGVPEYK